MKSHQFNNHALAILKEAHENHGFRTRYRRTTKKGARELGALSVLQGAGLVSIAWHPSGSAAYFITDAGTRVLDAALGGPKSSRIARLALIGAFDE